MLYLLKLLILIGFFVVPNDSMERQTLKVKIYEEILLEIVEELSLGDENERNEGIYKMVELFAGGKNAEKEDEDYNFTIPAEKAKEFLKKVFLALKDNNVIMPKVKKMDKKWICAAENQPKNSLKEILKGLFNVKLDEYLLEEYSKNFKPFLMILSAAIRICAIFGSETDQYSLEAFLMAYKCANVDESQQPMIYSYKTIACPTLIIYSYKILPIYKNNGQSWNLSDEIASIKFCKTKTDSAERNFNFLLKLSDVDVTPFAIVYLAERIRWGIEHGKMYIKIDNMKIFELAGVHFSGHKHPFDSMFRVILKGKVSFCLSNFLLNLLNRTLNSPNLKNYFVYSNLSEDLKAKQSEAEKQLFCDRRNEYNPEYVDYHWKTEIIEREHYLHFEEAIHINWNTNKEMFILIQLLKYRCFCSTRLYDWRSDDKFYRELHKECDEMHEILVSDGKDLIFNVKIIASDKKNKLLKPLQPLENIKQIKNAYKKLKTYLKKRVEANKKKERCTKEEEEDGYNAIVELNEEFGKAFEKVLKKF